MDGTIDIKGLQELIELKSKGAIAKGKTKWIVPVEGSDTRVEMVNKVDVTAFNDSKFTRQMAAKPLYATTTTCRIFEILKDAGIPVAYREQASPVSFIADKCDMIALEVIARRYAVGSYLNRHPEMKQDPPHRFHRLEIEFFLKTTKQRFTDREGNVQVLELEGEDDPLIQDPHNENLWWCMNPKYPAWTDSVRLASVQPGLVIDDERDDGGRIKKILEIEEITRQIFLILEKVWAMLGCRFIDFKIEFGITADINKRLVVADVIDNDSWRLRTADWQELSKQAFRDGESMEEVEKKYGIVTGMIDKFKVPEQVLVLWRGSINDAWDIDGKNLNGIPGLHVEKVTLSGHKQPAKCLQKLNELQRQYPSGVIIAQVGMSNGLGPILAARSTWPVIGVPATAEKSPNDVWSSLSLPSRVPMLTCLPKNADQAALNILAQQNPVLYMMNQFALEELDI